MKKIVALIAVGLMVVLLASPVFASDISDATYIGTINVVNTGTTASYVSIPFTLSTTNLVTGGYMDAACLNSCMQVNAADVGYMPAAGDKTDWYFISPSVPASSTSYAKLYTGGGDMDSRLCYFLMALGMSRGDAPTLEPGTAFDIEIKGYFDFSTFDGVNDGTEYILYKLGSIIIKYASTTSISTIYGGTNITTNGLTSGYHTFKLTSEGVAGNVQTYWDGVQKTTQAYSNGITDTANQWQWFYDASNLAYTVPAVEYIKIWVGGVLKQHIIWEYNAAAPYSFSDQSGNGHTMTTVLLRADATCSDPDVSATFETYIPIDESQAGQYSLSGGMTLVPGSPPEPADMYDEGETGGFIIDEPVNEALAVAGVPEAVFWFPVAFAIAIGVGFLVYGLTRQLIVQAIVSGVVMAVFCGGGVLGNGLLPWWTVLLFAIEATMLVVIENRREA